MALDRNQLQSMTKREHESMKEYAQRWRDLAAQVVPPMTGREMITIMVDMLPTFYYEQLVGYMPANFADLVFAGEKIESGLRKVNAIILQIKQREIRQVDTFSKHARGACLSP